MSPTLWSSLLAAYARFFGGQQQKLSDSSEDKGNADSIMGMEVQGLAIPAHGRATAATASSRELRRRSRARHPHFQVARGRGFDPASTLTAMDIEGVDVAVMYGTRGRQVLMHDELAPDYAAALARAYNNWAHEYCQKHPTRLKFAAQVAMHSIPAAIDEARRCVRHLGAVAIIGTPNPVNGQHLHDEACEPLWSALEELDVPIGFHPTGNTSLKDDAGRRYVGHANFQPIAHAIRNPVELMGALASMTTGGILEHQPSMLPSEYFKRQCYIALDVDEEPAVDVVEKVGADYFVVSTDYPHSDGAFPEAMEQFLGLPFPDEVRRKILWDNCARLYHIDTPAAASPPLSMRLSVS